MEFYLHEIDKDIMVIAADGGLNAQTAEEFVLQLEKLVQEGIRKIIVDCKRLDYISSYGIGVLLQIHRKLAQHGGDVKIANVKGAVATVLSVTRLDHLLGLYDDVDQARLAFRDLEQ